MPVPELKKFDTHPFRFLHRGAPPRTESACQTAISQIERNAADLIYRNEKNPASPESLRRLFMPYHDNGTFKIGERLGRAPYIREEAGDFRTWAETVAQTDLIRLHYAHQLKGFTDDRLFDTVPAVVADALQYQGSDGRLCDHVPNQNYIDYIRRAIGLHLYHDADHEFHSEERYNEVVQEIGLTIIARQLAWSKAKGQLTLGALKQLMVYSLLAGVIGIDMKCSHCAASKVGTENSAYCYGEDTPERIDKIWQWLARKSLNQALYCPELFAWDTYVKLVLAKPCTLVFLPDDLGETLFDLHRFQNEMLFNPGLKVIMAPRNGRFHNDAALEDIDSLLAEDCFADLRNLRDQGRFVVHEHGPRSGSVEGPKLSQPLVDTMLEADALFIKGSRSYELMADGIRLPLFAGQTVSREFSESILGVDAQAGVPALTFDHAFPGFWGFTERHLRRGPLFPTGKDDWQVSMTARESARFCASEAFQRLIGERSRVDVSQEIVDHAMNLSVPPHLVAI